MAGYDNIIFLSDYGLEDHLVGVCHGVIARIAPNARVIDLSHAIRPQDVRHGATLLAQSVPFLPRAVHLAVVDPMVGGERGMVAVEAGGQVLVGPDNGLLVWAAERLGGVERVHALKQRAYRLEPVSRTFHGRDVFAPAAAHLALGLPPGRFGRAVADPVRLPWPEAGPTRDGVSGPSSTARRTKSLCSAPSSSRSTTTSLSPAPARTTVAVEAGRKPHPNTQAPACWSVSLNAPTWATLRCISGDEKSMSP